MTSVCVLVPPHNQISDSIISKARETLNRAIQLVNNTPRWGGRVVYGDTDRFVQWQLFLHLLSVFWLYIHCILLYSLFVLLKGTSKEEAFRIGKEIVEAVTADNPKPVKLKFEKVFTYKFTDSHVNSLSHSTGLFAVCTADKETICWICLWVCRPKGANIWCQGHWDRPSWWLSCCRQGYHFTSHSTLLLRHHPLH